MTPPRSGTRGGTGGAAHFSTPLGRAGSGGGRSGSGSARKLKAKLFGSPYKISGNATKVFTENLAEEAEEKGARMLPDSEDEMGDGEEEGVAGGVGVAGGAGDGSEDEGSLGDFIVDEGDEEVVERARKGRKSGRHKQHRRDGGGGGGGDDGDGGDDEGGDGGGEDDDDGGGDEGDEDEGSEEDESDAGINKLHHVVRSMSDKQLLENYLKHLLLCKLYPGFAEVRGLEGGLGGGGEGSGGGRGRVQNLGGARGRLQEGGGGGSRIWGGGRVQEGGGGGSMIGGSRGCYWVLVNRREHLASCLPPRVPPAPLFTPSICNSSTAAFTPPVLAPTLCWYLQEAETSKKASRLLLKLAKDRMVDVLLG